MFQHNRENTEKEIVCPPVTTVGIKVVWDLSLIILMMRSVAARGLTGSDCHPVSHLLDWPASALTIRSININILHSTLTKLTPHKLRPNYTFDRNIVGLSALFRHFNTQIRFYWNKKSSLCGHCGQLVTIHWKLLYFRLSQTILI